MDAVATGAAAQSDDAVAIMRLAVDEVPRDEADAAAVNERVTDVAIVEEDAAADGGDAHAVAVIADAGDDVLEDALGGQHARRKRLEC